MPVRGFSRAARCRICRACPRPPVEPRLGLRRHRSQLASGLGAARGDGARERGVGPRPFRFWRRRVAVAARDGLDAPPRAEPKGLQARNLKSLKDEQKELSDRNSSLEDNNKTLQQRFNALQQQCASVLREKGDLAEELRQCKRQLEAQNSSSAAQAKRDRDELAEAW